MTSPVLVLFGSGPGIGSAIATLFARNHFTTIALISRNASRLASEKAAVEAAAGRKVDVHTFPTDISDIASLRKTLAEVETLGPVGMVYHNPARINPMAALSMGVEEVEEDFKTGNLALYAIAQWAVPLLQKSGHSSPSFFVTNSHFPEKPMAVLLSLSISKASQQTFLICLDEAFGKEIHFGLVKACGPVADENLQLNATNIAKRAEELYEQKKGSWELMTSIVDPK